MMAILRFLFRLAGNFVFILFLLAVLMAGMGLGGFFLLDYLIKGETVVAPNVMGMSKSRAIETLTESELLVKVPIEEVSDEDTPPGIVIEQRPFPNTVVKKGRRISVKISKGPRLAMIPNLIGRPDKETVYDLRSVDLQIDQRSNVFHSTQPESVVVAQDPLPGARLVPEKSMDILVSLGPKPVDYIMPNYTGMDSKDVLSSASPKPFIFSEDEIEYKKSSDPAEWGRVIEQRPEPGARIAAGEHVTFTVASSGMTLGAIRFVNIRFDAPPVMIYPRRPALLVWDNASKLNGAPSVLPLRLDTQFSPVNVWMPVYGDAVAALCAMRDDQSLPEYEIIDKRFYPAVFEPSDL
ncbi:MAG: PASTA domain-containing protein [Candidatus Hinthialibacter antarcticus]|nr:PASTA domain-containing protein [Candidatus Hinthialibacter antarcticus]